LDADGQEMNAQSSEHPIPADSKASAKLSRALVHGLPRRPDMKVAVASVLRERRFRAHSASQAPAKRDAGEAEVIALLYGDASLRKRAFDTQPSHIWSATAASLSSESGDRSAPADDADDAQQ
jgi:hypothetical protein